MTDQEAFCSLRNWITCIDGALSKRQDMMLTLVEYLDQRIQKQSVQISELTEAAERYRELAEQRLLNHLNIDQEHIINICNESLQEVATDELSSMALGIDPYGRGIQPTLEPLSIPPIPVAEIDFQHDPTRRIYTHHYQETSIDNTLNRHL